MMRTFNNGIGLVMVIPETAVQEVIDRITAMNENVFVIGNVQDGKTSPDRVIWKS